MAIETLNEYNAQATCCCPQILCPIPEQVCESMSRTSSCADDDYTDALAEFEAHEAWIAEHAAWVIAHAAWVIDHAAWVSCEETTPGECGVEPTEPIEPIEPPDTPEPDKPAGYDDVEHGCFGPYEQPAGDITEKIPLIYRTWDRATRTGVFDGQGYAKESVVFGADSRESVSHVVYVNDAITSSTGETNIWEDSICTNSATATVGYINPNLISFGDPVDSCVLTPSTRTSSSGQSSDSGSMPLILQGCPGPFPDTGYEEAWSFTQTSDITDTLGESISQLDLVTRAEGKIPDTWPAISEDADCEASALTDWPTVADLMTDEAWPTCDDFADSPLITTATGTATAVRFRWRIPSTWVNPVTGAIVTFPGTYFRIMWDVINEPEGWDAMIDDPEYEPPIPNDPPEPIPQIPKPGRPTRSWYSEDEEWIWTGPGDPEEAASWLSDYYYINAPTTFIGTRRLVNIRFICRESWGLGTLPQVIGDAVTLPDPA